jgi:superfamily II DNA or RNA helicase
MGIRDVKQQEFAEKWLRSNRLNIMYLAPRFGKIFTAINILENYPEGAKVIIAYPDVKIKKSWLEDFKKREYNNPNITFTTHLSIKKYKEQVYDLIIIDEIHLLSAAQIEVCKELFGNGGNVLGLTGTLSKWTKKLLREELNLNVLVEYTISQAIEDGIIPDYEIIIHKVALDNKILNDYNGKKRTEKQRFNSFQYVAHKLEAEGQPSFFMKLKIIDVLMTSLSRKNKTIELIQQYKNERLLIFCGRINIADGLGISSYHSKSTEKEKFEDFANGKGNHLAVIKIGNTGVTYKPLNKVIINYTDSNPENLTQKILRCMSMEYDNPDKKASIHIICSTEEIELKWLRRALEFFSPDKIKNL